MLETLLAIGILVAVLSLPLSLRLVLDRQSKAHADALKAAAEAHGVMLREHTATIGSLFTHLRETQTVGGRPFELEKRAYEIAEEKNRLEKERLAIERVRLGQRFGMDGKPTERRLPKSPEG